MLRIATTRVPFCSGVMIPCATYRPRVNTRLARFRTAKTGAETMAVFVPRTSIHRREHGFYPRVISRYCSVVVGRDGTHRGLCATAAHGPYSSDLLA